MNDLYHKVNIFILFEGFLMRKSPVWFPARVHDERTVLGYHGCDAQVAERLLAGEPFTPSDNDYDWLGRGVYFWEYGEDRAFRFAQDQQRRGTVQTPALVGAVLRLGNCFDLMDTRFMEDLARGYEVWASVLRERGVPLLRNTGRTPEKKLRRLDCAVLNWYLDRAAEQGTTWDTVRCGFVEGGPVYPGSGIFRETHVQLAVRNPHCILEVFRPTLGRRHP
jgi:hypothetical protein